jgi:hypothetical protein
VWFVGLEAELITSGGVSIRVMSRPQAITPMAFNNATVTMFRRILFMILLKSRSNRNEDADKEIGWPNDVGPADFP